MQAIPINFYYGMSKTQRRSSEPHIYDKKSDGDSRLVSRQPPVNRVLNRLDPTQSNNTKAPQTQTTKATNETAPTAPPEPMQLTQPPDNHYKHIKLQTPQHTPNGKPRRSILPNRNLYRRRSTYTPSRSYSVDYTITPFSHKNKRKNRRKSPAFSSVTRDLESKSKSKSKPKKRSHSFSISQNTSNCKAYSRRLPTRYSPSITQYSPRDLQITPPPQQLPPVIDMAKNLRIRQRSHSLSRSFSKSKSKPKPKPKAYKKENTLNIPSSLNVAHILEMSDHEKERETKEEQETIQINNGKSLLFSSWFSSEKNEECDDVLLDINQSEIDDVIKAINDINSSPSNDNEEVLPNGKKEGSVIAESQSNASFTTGLKPPRKYHTAAESNNEKISFRDFLAQENRKALQREIVNVENKTPLKKREKMKLPQDVDRFFILLGNTMKVDYGLPDGPYTLYKFIITYNHQYSAPSAIGKACKSAESSSTNLKYDESPRKKTSHWSIRKRYSDFVTFNNNVIAEIKELKGKTIKLPKLPPKTFKKNFNPSFVGSRHAALLSYLNRVIIIRELQCSITLLTFLGAINNHTVPYNDKFLDSRMTLSVYISNYADTGDVLLFETKSYIAASLRSVTSSNYDHVALVYRDSDGSHTCSGCNAANANANGLYLIESTIDGVRTYPLKGRLKQWSLLCPQIVVRRLKLLKAGVQEKKRRVLDERQSASLDSIKQKPEDSNNIYTKYDYAAKGEDFYHSSAQFIEKVNGLDYAIWSNVFRLSDVPFEKQKSFFCSQLVTAFFKFMALLPDNVKTHRILPGHFSDDRSNKMKLPLRNCLLLKENLLLFKLPNINNAKHQHHYQKHHNN